MRTAIFSDVHGNAIALDAVLADCARRSVDQYVCLGDAIQGGPQPAQVVARLRDLGSPIVMGNADDWLLTGVESGAEHFSEERRRQLDAVRIWSLTQLSEADRAFIASFSPTVEVDLGHGQTLLGFHGSPHSFDDMILPGTPEEEVNRLLGGFEPHILAGGHTHIQQIRHLGRSFYFGCGSAGRAYRHGQTEENFQNDPWAEYAILTVEEDTLGLEFRRVPFDVEALIAVYQTCGRPYAQEAVAQYRRA
jgi:predicted phosphodiesterase